MEERSSPRRQLCARRLPTPHQVSNPAMQHDRQTQEVRSHVRGVFSQHGVSEDARIEETIMIRDGYFCGRRFHCEEMQAVWFIEEDQLKIYNQEGIVESKAVSVMLQPLEKAA